MMYLNNIPDPAPFVGWLETIRNYPLMISLLLVGFSVGFFVHHFGIKKGFFSTPTITSKMEKIVKELEAVRIENAELRKDNEHMKQDYEKYHALLESFVAARRLDLLDKMALEHEEK